MNKLFRTPILILFPLIFAILYMLPGSLNKMILRSEITFYQWIQPSESLSEDIVIITIGDEDVQLLNGWPITRDYYSYAILALKQSGAQAIGLDIFFSGPDKHYPRYDSTMADFISSAGNVVLPMYFSELEYTDFENGLTIGNNPHYSIPIISQAAAANGFSNLGPDPIILEIPLMVSSPERRYYSFAAEIVRVFNANNHSENDKTRNGLPGKRDKATKQSGYIYLNYPDIQNFKPTYSFVNLLQTFRKNPESINLDGKIAVIINTVTGVAQIKSTSLRDRLPASFVHVTAVNNLLLENWFKIIPSFIGCLIILILGMVFLLNLPEKGSHIIKFVILLLPAVYIIFAILGSIISQILFPLFYPLLSFGLGVLIAKVAKVKTIQIESRERYRQLDVQLGEKEDQLELTRKQLKDLGNQLNQETEITDKIREQVEQQKMTIIDLEKEMTDLQVYRGRVKKPTVVDVEGIIFAKNSIMQQVMETVTKVSTDDIPVLISGETGTGKELIARKIHQGSKRNKAPFVGINCGSLPETLLESELFGHEKGSFTGAMALRKGRFELAEGGTVFLDEVTETSLAFQARLLRILQESTFERVGGQEQIKSDVRIIAATNKDIQKLIVEEKFRSDLYYRLNGFPIFIPPLRERVDDIILMAEHFLKKHEYKNISAFSKKAVEILKTYSWPGNVRELENCIRRAAILAQSDDRTMIQENDLAQDIQVAPASFQLQMVHKPLEDQILELLRSFKFSHSSIAQTASMLGNRDRGTITEYFKGICFQHIVNAGFNISEAVRNIAGSAEKETYDNVSQKVHDYISNLKNYAGLSPQADIPANRQAPPFRGLPKKYDPYLDQILANFKKLL